MVFNTMYERQRPAPLEFKDKSRTQQQFAADADINVIMKKYEKTGFPVIQEDKKLVYGDFSNIKSYEEAQMALVEANDAFMQLPARIRDKFDNDPGKLLAFVEDENNRDEAVKLGIIEMPPQPEIKPPEGGQS